MLGSSHGPDPHDLVARLDRPLALRHGDDHQSVALGRSAKGKQSLAGSEGGREILPSHALSVVVGAITRLHLHHDRQELAARHRSVDRSLQPLGEFEDRLLPDTQVGVGVGPLMQRHDRVEIAAQRFGLV